MTIWARVLVAFMLVGAWGGMVGFHGDITQLTDQQIESAIKQRLAMDGRIDATNIHVKVEQGKVTLSGAVVTVDDKGLAEAIVTGTLVGVKSLTNNIAVVPVLVKDEAIRKAVEAALRSVPALLPDKANKIKVSVNDGIVALKGAVEKPLFRRAAEKAAASVKGVKSVTNLVEVVGKPRPDNEIEKDVVTYLQWSPLVELENHQLIAHAHDELLDAIPLVRTAALLRATVVREPRATFSLAPGQPARPDTTTLIRGLYLAGDWIETGLPATIESAVRSGHWAAEAVLATETRRH